MDLDRIWSFEADMSFGTANIEIQQPLNISPGSPQLNIIQFFTRLFEFYNIRDSVLLLLFFGGARAVQSFPCSCAEYHLPCYYVCF